MLSSINTISFTSKIIKDKYFNEGIKTARKDAKNEYTQNSTNSFINAIRHIENDGENDIYSIEFCDTKRENCQLLKNGHPIYSIEGYKNGYSVIKLLTEFNLGYIGANITKPAVPAIADKFANETSLLKIEKAIEELETARKTLEKHNQEVTLPKVTKELNSALDEFSIYA
jgi:hypothetical protein